MLNWALAPQILPDQEGAGQSFYIMIPAIHVYGQAIPAGGSQELPNAMARYVEAHGGQVLTGCPVAEILVDDNQARGVRLDDGRTLTARRAVVSALEPRQTFLRLVGERKLASDFIDMVRKFSFGQISVCRLQLALREPPRFLNGADMSACLFHRIVDSTEQMRRFYAELAMGLPPSDPFLWCACWTLLDPSRAPAGMHTLILDTFVSNWLADGRTWAEIGKAYAHDVLLPKLRQYAPNINEKTILGSYVQTRETLEAATHALSKARPTAASGLPPSSGTSGPSPGTHTTDRP